MARSKSIEQQLREINLNDESYQVAEYQAKSVARMRKKAGNGEMMNNFFKSVLRLSKMDSTITTTDDADDESTTTTTKETNDGVITNSPGVTAQYGSPPAAPPPVNHTQQDDDVSWDSSWDAAAANASWDQEKKLNWRKYKITEADKRLLAELKEAKINKMTIELNSAQNMIKMKHCLSAEIDQNTTPEMVDNMLKELFEERQKQVEELGGEKVGDDVDGGKVTVLEPPPGLGLFNFSSMNSECIHQFELWCQGASAARFLGLLILNKGKHNKILKLKYMAHPVLNGTIILMVETDDECYFGTHFVEGFGQMQIFNPAQKYMEDVIGIDAGQEWRTKCWNSISVIKDIEYSQPMKGLGLHHQFGGFDSLMNDARTIRGVITRESEAAEHMTTMFIKDMNFLIQVQQEDFADGPDGGDAPDGVVTDQQLEEIQRDIDTASGTTSSQKHETSMDVEKCFEEDCFSKHLKFQLLQLL